MSGNIIWKSVDAEHGCPICGSGVGCAYNSELKLVSCLRDASGLAVPGAGSIHIMPTNGRGQHVFIKGRKLDRQGA